MRAKSWITELRGLPLEPSSHAQSLGRPVQQEQLVVAGEAAHGRVAKSYFLRWCFLERRVLVSPFESPQELQSLVEPGREPCPLCEAAKPKATAASRKELVSCEVAPWG